MDAMAEKYRIFPCKQTEKKLLSDFGICKEIHNTLLGLHNKSNFKGRQEFNSLVRDIKATLPERYYSTYSQVLQNVTDRLTKSFDHYYRRLEEIREKKKQKKEAKNKGDKKRKKNKRIKPGFPRFKTGVKSITYPQSGFKIHATKGRHHILYVSKIGNIRIRCHRNIKGRIKTLTIKRFPSGKWYAFITVKTVKKPEIINVKPENVVGIDIGITYVTYDSNGKYVTNPGFMKEHEKKQKSLARRLSRKRKGSKNRERARVKLARQNEKLVNMREDFIHKLSRYYANNFDAIGVEDFSISQMVRDNRLAKHILNSCWGKFRRMLRYKAENAGKSVISVESRGTTQRCSRCGEKVPKELWDRQHTCQHCGLDIPRDYNSALEVRNLTLKELFGLGQGMPEVTPVEMGPLPVPLLGTGQASSGKQEPCAKGAIPS